MTVPDITLNNGLQMPQIGLGTWKSKPGEVTNAVKAAIDNGYRHIDCALCYQNEDEVGVAIQQKISEGIVKREDLFITSKIWNTYHSKSKVSMCLDQTLKSLQTSYLDLLLIHWPMGYQEGGGLMPQDSNGKTLYSDVDYLETWAGLEEAHKAGLTKSIGLSNFNSKQIKRVMDSGTVKPAVNQVEIHPYLNNEKLVQWCKDNGIVVTAYSPLGSPDRPWAKPDDPQLLEEPVIRAIAEAHKKTPAQILIRFAIERGIVVIPKSVTPARIASNFDVFDFSLTPEEMKKIRAFDRADGRALALEWVKDHPFYPFQEEF